MWPAFQLVIPIGGGQAPALRYTSSAMSTPPLRPAGQKLLEAQYANMNLCVRCGLCHSVCPTYQQSFIEPEGPRGRIAIAKALVEGHLDLSQDLLTHWDNCILCDACSAICPSGVHMEAIGQAVRAATVEAKGENKSMPLRMALCLVSNPGLLRTAMGMARVYQHSGLQKLVRGSGLLKAFGLVEAEAMLPPSGGRPLVARGQVWKAEGEQRGTVALLAGCVMSAAFGDTDRATARVLAANGCEVHLSAGQGCCGALHAHRGERAGAQALARKNIDVFEKDPVDAIIVNAAGCGATMKQYGELLADDPAYAERAHAFSAKVKDFSEFLAELGPRKPVRALNVTVTYQEPCHLANAQRIREAPRQLLKAIPGLELREMAESALCCGSGALYNLTQEESSSGLRARKLRNAAATGAEVIVTANPGCLMQLSRGDMRVVHIADLLDEAYRA